MSRERILGRVRSALAARAPSPHPGALSGARAPEPAAEDPLALFRRMLEAAGGELVALGSLARARAWLRELEAPYASACVGATVPAELAPHRPPAEPENAELSVGMARCAVAETGSLVLDARDGRRAQLLAPTHVVWLRAADLHATLGEALRSLAHDLPSALALHSGPSKSADIGQILVRGVHGPGRLIVGLLDGPAPEAPGPDLPHGAPSGDLPPRDSSA